MPAITNYTSKKVERPFPSLPRWRRASRPERANENSCGQRQRGDMPRMLTISISAAAVVIHLILLTSPLLEFLHGSLFGAIKGLILYFYSLNHLLF